MDAPIASPIRQAAVEDLDRLRALYRDVRAFSERLCEPLETEDYVVQSMPDVSPTKWHLAHTSWFFETFVIAKASKGHRPIDPLYPHLFNSYYNSLGDPFRRAARGHLSRPTVRQVCSYRRHVDEAMERVFHSGEAPPEVAFAIELGVNHEEQHQELILTDIKHVLSQNPMRPAYRSDAARPGGARTALRFSSFDGGILPIGHEGRGFAFDNESPRHDVLVPPFELASRPVSSGEYIEFMGEDGYRRPELWLSDGWDLVRAEGWRAPLYWENVDARWHQLTLAGFRDVDPGAPVCHVSYYEADAYARWYGARLPREEEWEAVAAHRPPEGNFVESGALHPAPMDAANAPAQLFGDVWEWTASPYVAYPGYAPFPGSLGEYNGKFMCNQLVLRGGSCATPRRHIRATYRNFFPPRARWQFSGIRLAR